MSDGYLSKDRAHLAERQRRRRARMTRIDYMPSVDALAAIEAKRATCRPGSVAATNRAVIDAIVGEWAELTGLKYREAKQPMTPAKQRELADTYARANDFEPAGSNATSTRADARANHSGDDRNNFTHRAGVHANDSGVGHPMAGRIASARRRAIKSGERVICGGRRRRDGQTCEALSVPGKRRCKWHGGCSTGPRTPEGRAVALANLRRYKRAEATT